MEYIYAVDYESGEMVEDVFTPTLKDIKVFSGEKSLYTFIAETVESKYKITVSRIKRITKYNFGGEIEKFNLVYEDGDLVLTSAGVLQVDEEVILP